MKHTQESTAEFLDYIDNMDELEMRREIALYERGERYKKYGSITIGILSVVVVVVLVLKLI